MGNNATKESPPASTSHFREDAGGGRRSSTGPIAGPSDNQHFRRRGSVPDLSLLGMYQDRESAQEVRRETRAEREARKLEKERREREKERERSLREEGVDGGYLVTLGTYTGPEDFSKGVVRQLMIERRLAPFWKGLNDFSDSWTEHQLIAVARGLPLPAPDEIPQELDPYISMSDSNQQSQPNTLNVPIHSRSASYNNYPSLTISPSHPASSLPSPISPIGSPSSSSPLFRGRAKTLAALTTSSRNGSQTDMTPQEIHLPHDSHVNGQAVEVFLYKDASECPICFLYYPPYLNKTRCCDQPICSECFVQIKRPDPHAPEHADPSAPDDGRAADGLLVSEPAACPFCVQPEFGVTYEPPPFRRGLAYANQTHGHPLANVTSAMSSSSSLGSGPGPGTPGGQARRRTVSISANAATVITTDRIRPDWAKRLSDARAHAMRRSAAATALHNAAYVLGTAGDSRGFSFGRRRRTLFPGSGSIDNDQNGLSGSETVTVDGLEALFPPRVGSLNSGLPGGGNDLFPGRSSSRRSRMEELEEMMMMEAIRLSLQAEEERKKKEDKEAAKEAKKEEKKKAKEAKDAKKAERSGRKNSSNFYPAGSNDSASSYGLGTSSSAVAEGKGKGVDRTSPPAATQHGFTPLTEPASTIHDPSLSEATRSKQPSDHNLAHPHPFNDKPPSPFNPFADPLGKSSPLSSTSSSFVASEPGSAGNDAASGSGVLGYNSSFDALPDVGGADLEHATTAGSQKQQPPPSTSEPTFNFRSLAAMIDDNSHSDRSPVAEAHKAEQGKEMSKPGRASDGEGAHQTPDVTVRYRDPGAWREGGMNGSIDDSKHSDDVGAFDADGAEKTAAGMASR